MKSYSLVICVMAAIVFSAGIALSQDHMIYPREGQDQEQMDRDKFECHRWAVEQSGFDPTQAQAAPQSSGQKQSSAGKSALRGGGVGAAVGAGIGAITGGRRGAKKGAAVGGVTGGAAGGASGAEKQRQADARQAQDDADIAQKRAAYNRALKACMEGRGYTVK